MFFCVLGAFGIQAFSNVSRSTEEVEAVNSALTM